MQSRVDRQIRALALAKACAANGARVRTISRITGLLPRDLLHLLFPDRQAVPRGRSPDSPEWYHSANLLGRAEASIVVAVYCRLRAADLSAGEALLGAYRHYCGVCQAPHRISFDRAFDLVAHTDGIWITETQSFSLVTCPRCHSAFLAAFGAVARSNDPYQPLRAAHITNAPGFAGGWLPPQTSQPICLACATTVTYCFPTDTTSPAA